MGRVSNSSIVPCFFSSEIILIVTAGTRNKKIQGANVNKLSKVAYPLSKTLFWPGNTHINNPIANRKTIITMYPVIVLKNSLISFFSNAIIYFDFRYTKINDLFDQT